MKANYWTEESQLSDTTKKIVEWTYERTFRELILYIDDFYTVIYLRNNNLIKVNGLRVYRK